MPIDPARAARRIASSLEAVGNPERAVQEKRYLKSEMQHFGVGMPGTRAVAKAFLKEHPDLTRSELVALVEALWKEPVLERRMISVELLDLRGLLLEARDIALIERFIRESKTWALVDGLSATVAGSLVERFDKLGEVLDRWATDEDFWVRRSAMLALLEPLRRGEGDFERFARYAEAMLGEKEFFIRKAIGWVLREAGKQRPDIVAQWLRPRAAACSGVTIREAVKYLPEKERKAILLARGRSSKEGRR